MTSSTVIIINRLICKGILGNVRNILLQQKQREQAIHWFSVEHQSRVSTTKQLFTLRTQRWRWLLCLSSGLTVVQLSEQISVEVSLELLKHCESSAHYKQVHHHSKQERYYTTVPYVPGLSVSWDLNIWPSDEGDPDTVRITAVQKTQYLKSSVGSLATDDGCEDPLLSSISSLRGLGCSLWCWIRAACPGCLHTWPQAIQVFMCVCTTMLIQAFKHGL